MANDGFTFDRWSGCDSVSGKVCTAMVSDSRSVTAKFTPAEEKKFTVSVTKEVSLDRAHTMGGKVNSNTPTVGTKISCGTTCSALYKKESSVTLSATPSTSFQKFVRWEGEFCNGSFNQDCTFPMPSQDVVERAIFENIPKIGEGNSDGLRQNSCTAFGWGFNWNEPHNAASIIVMAEMQDNSNYPTPFPFATLTTNELRKDVNDSRGIEGLHGYSFDISAALKKPIPNFNRVALPADRLKFSFYVNAGGKRYKLDGQDVFPPKYCFNKPPCEGVMGNVDEPAEKTSKTLKGWTLIKNQLEPNNFAVHIYNQQGTELNIKNPTKATYTYRNDVNTHPAIQTTGIHGFEEPLPDLPPGNYTVAVFGTDKDGKECTIGGSPKPFVVEGRVTGALNLPTNNSLSGWAVYKPEPSLAVTVKLILTPIDGPTRKVQSFEVLANQSGNVPSPYSGPHAYTFKIPSTLPPAKYEVRAYGIDPKAPDTKIVELAQSPQTIEVKASAIQGYLDGVREGVAIGWARRKTSEIVSISLVLQKDGSSEVITQPLTADESRVDLTNAGIGSHAFRWILPELTNGDYTLRATAYAKNGESRELEGSPMAVKINSDACRMKICSAKAGCKIASSPSDIKTALKDQCNDFTSDYNSAREIERDILERQGKGRVISLEVGSTPLELEGELRKIANEEELELYQFLKIMEVQPGVASVNDSTLRKLEQPYNQSFGPIHIFRLNSNYINPTPKCNISTSGQPRCNWTSEKIKQELFILDIGSRRYYLVQGYLSDGTVSSPTGRWYLLGSIPSSISSQDFQNQVSVISPEQPDVPLWVKVYEVAPISSTLNSFFNEKNYKQGVIGLASDISLICGAGLFSSTVKASLSVGRIIRITDIAASCTAAGLTIHQYYAEVGSDGELKPVTKFDVGFALLSAIIAIRDFPAVKKVYEGATKNTSKIATESTTCLEGKCAGNPLVGSGEVCQTAGRKTGLLDDIVREAEKAGACTVTKNEICRHLPDPPTLNPNDYYFHQTNEGNLCFIETEGLMTGMEVTATGRQVTCGVNIARPEGVAIWFSKNPILELKPGYTVVAVKKSVVEAMPGFADNLNGAVLIEGKCNAGLWHLPKIPPNQVFSGKKLGMTCSTGSSQVTKSIAIDVTIGGTPRRVRIAEEAVSGITPTPAADYAKFPDKMGGEVLEDLTKRGKTMVLLDVDKGVINGLDIPIDGGKNLRSPDVLYMDNQGNYGIAEITVGKDLAQVGEQEVVLLDKKVAQIISGAGFLESKTGCSKLAEGVLYIAKDTRTTNPGKLYEIRNNIIYERFSGEPVRLSGSTPDSSVFIEIRKLDYVAP